MDAPGKVARGNRAQAVDTVGKVAKGNPMSLVDIAGKVASANSIPTVEEGPMPCRLAMRPLADNCRSSVVSRGDYPTVWD